MKLEKIVVGLITTTALCSQAALASIYPGNVSIVNTELPYPNQKTLEVNYRMFGSEIYNSGKTVNFALTQNGGQTLIDIGRDFADISCGSSGLGTRCTPSNAQQTYRVNLDMVLSEQNKNALANACVPYEFQVQATYNISKELSSNTVKIGTVKAADWLISSGSFSPNQVPAGGQVVINAEASTICPQRSGAAPTLAVFLANANNQLLYFYGETSVLLPYGSRHTITVPIPSGLTAGTYYLVLVVDRNDVVAETNENNNVATGKITVLNSAVGGQSIAPENEQSANTSGSITYLSRTDEDNQNFVDPQLPVTSGMKVLKSKETNQDDLFNAINQLDAVALPEHQE
ncbi:CARDB domain-containing protein [Vibrio ruber]|uniref:CARDB domain-containing protein n=1 Tax=Vibrio ruber TaxID=184755 RepID=UPI002892E78C|nr:CARDB domain-containing protein [Vibrio ruber]WNJ96367.1 CARDB domain-containing protein [Vibrio ruber]